MRRLLRPSAVLAALVIGITAAAVGCSYVNPPALALSERSDAEPYFTLSAKDLIAKVEDVSKATTTVQRPASYKASAYADVLNKLVSSNVLKREVQNRHIVPTDEDKQVAQQQLQSSRQNGAEPSEDETAYTTDAVALAFALADDALKTGKFDLDSLAHRLYDSVRQNGGLVTPGQLCLHFVEIDTPSAASGATPSSAELADATSKAAAAKARLDGGESFEAVANDVSSAKANVPGGDLGCRPTSGSEQGTLPSELVDALKNVAAGAISNPITLQSSVYVIRVDSRVDEKVTPYEAVKDRAEQQAKLQLGTTFVTDRLREIYAKTVVTIDPQFGTWDAKNLQVTTPEGAATPTTPTTVAADLGLNGPPGVPASPVPTSEPPGSETTTTAAESTTTTTRASGTSSTTVAGAGGSTTSTAGSGAASTTSTTSTSAVGR